jgi:hypothetical protein
MLEDLNALLEAAKELPELPSEGEYQKLPDGEYQAIIDKVEFKESKSGKLMFVWEFIITEGQYVKYHEWKYSMLTSPENMQRLITDLKKFGVNTESMEKIENDFDLLINVPVTLKIESKVSKQNPDAEPFRNISVKPCNS